VDIKFLEALATSQFVWAIVAIAIGWAFYKEIKQRMDAQKEENNKREEQLIQLYETQKTESRAREERLMTHIEKTTETLNMIDSKMEKMDKRIDDVWNKIGGGK
jgi:uncharacterized protein HemX